MRPLRAALWPLAALIVVVLSATSLDRSRLHEWFADDLGSRRTTVMAPSTPVPPSDNELLTVSLSEDMVPRGANVGSILIHYTLPSGGEWSREAACCPGQLIEYVVSGRYSIRAESETLIVRSDGTEQAVASSQEVILLAGDTLLARNEASMTIASLGPEPLEFLSWSQVQLGEDGAFEESLAVNINNHPYDAATSVMLPQGPLTLQISEIELLPGTEATPDRSLVALAVTAPRNQLGTPVAAAVHEVDGSIANAGRQPSTVYVVTLNRDKSADGTPIP